MVSASPYFQLAAIPSCFIIAWQRRHFWFEPSEVSSRNFYGSKISSNDRMRKWLHSGALQRAGDDFSFNVFAWRSFDPTASWPKHRLLSTPVTTEADFALLRCTALWWFTTLLTWYQRHWSVDCSCFEPFAVGGESEQMEWRSAVLRCAYNTTSKSCMIAFKLLYALRLNIGKESQCSRAVDSTPM